ncbi:hypothetical protein ANN_04159 [Periplaneta americana]|uniref:Uncharacterized protein n=1 Tax=Periplaneta americana TaxID=6978 RepID=A0ABQ8T7T3_PERAM|nr:hypothetical protein ANN_04159 [Periplaneta americana]
MAGLCEGGNEPPGSLKARKNCSGAGYRSRDLWLNVPALCQLSYPGTPLDTVSTFPFISTELAWADETPETHIECTQTLCDWNTFFRKPQFQVTQSLCALDVGLWRFVSPRELWIKREKLRRCRVEFLGSSVGRALEEEKKLAGPLAKKKLPPERYTERNDERKKRGRKKISVCLEWLLSQDKSWASLINDKDVIDLPRSENVPVFCIIITKHDCLAANLARFIIIPSPNGMLRNMNVIMNWEHIRDCTALQSPQQT